MIELEATLVGVCSVQW